MEEFYRRVLPASGPFTILTGVTGPDGKLAEQRHWNGLKTHADVVEMVQRQSMLPVNVFLAVGSYAGKNRQDPIAKRAVYLDLDGKDFNGSISDAVRALGTFVKATALPPPNLYVHSGRGLHVYWCLDRDVPIEEWLVVARALKEKHIELDFAADRTVTADPARILRCPGTLNRKGPEPIPCRVMSDNGGVTRIEDIAAALAVQVVPQGSIARLAALVGQDDLSSKREYSKLSEDDVRDLLDFVHLSPMGDRSLWTTVLCAVQDWGDKSQESFEVFHDWSSGEPDYTGRDDCWKTWCSFNPGGGFTIGTLIKLAVDAGWTPPQPADSITPVAAPSLAQSLMAPSVPNASSTAAPQIAQGVIASKLMLAADHAAKSTGKIRFELTDAVQWLSNEFVLVSDQDGIYYSVTNRMHMSRVVIDDMLTRYMPLNASGVPINASAIMRRYGTVHAVNSLGFHPGAPSVYMENGLSYVNQYLHPESFVQMSAAEIKLIEHFWWQYVFPREEDRPFGEYLLGCYGHLVQHPDVKIASAPVMVSKEFGTGKTTVMFDIPRALAGVHVTKLVSNKTLRSSFSDFVNGSHFLHFDEVHINGKWDSDDTANSMKNLITGKTVEVHPKGMKSFNIPNRLFITATSNYEDAISLPADDERRWGVYYLRPPAFPTAAIKAAYFKAIHSFITSPAGSGKLRWYFSQVDLSGFDPQAAPPMTAAKRRMVQKSQVYEVQILKDLTSGQDGCFAKDVFTTEAVRQMLQAETGKVYNNVQVREFILRAIPEAAAVAQIRAGAERIRPWAWKNHGKWNNATSDELRTELKSS